MTSQITITTDKGTFKLVATELAEGFTQYVRDEYALDADTAEKHGQRLSDFIEDRYGNEPTHD